MLLKSTDAMLSKVKTAMTAEVLIGDGDGRLSPHPLRAAVLGEVHARPFTALVRAVARAALRVRYVRRQGQGRPRGDDQLLRIARAAAAVGRRKTSPRLVRHDDAALGTAFRIHHLHLGIHCRPDRDAVSSRRLVARLADAAVAAAGAAAGRGRPASVAPTIRRAPRRSVCSIAPASRSRRIPTARRCMRRTSSPARRASCACW